MIIVQLVSSGLLIASCLALVYGLYILHRNNKVLEFRCYILDRCTKAQIASIYNGVNELGEYDAIYRKYSYNDMLYSFKPLKLEKWFTKEEIDLLNKYN